ncbi:MAG TPA: cysteine--tRNA ligase [Gammaproteobacteria bacterium]|jgi:cysteinyl-tRNA synthetase|nr:cysteine--tRNA ligase [Gammaproteobacteria bacterium]
MLQIHNTLTRQKDEFKPIQSGKINFYVCGVTVYDHCHIGHARTYTAVDVIVRYLRWRGYEVNYVRNITDIDDKIIKRANENKEDYSELTKRFTDEMHKDFDELGFVRPDHEPRATEYIQEMIALINEMIANKHAYVADNGDVYFDVRSFKSYGCLSHHNLDELESGARVEVAEVKRDPLDFVLWKIAKPGEPTWQSPWGEGRPGWHLECSAMSMKLLGKHFDIHAGGRDLIFPHHENEIAQSEAATREQFVNYWMHTGFLQIGKEKMSKSLGNFVTIREAITEHEPEVVRYFLLASHYRSPLVYTDEVIGQSMGGLMRLYNALYKLPEGKKPENSEYEKRFIEAMNDDFNSPVALSVLFDLAHEIQRIRKSKINEAADLGALLKALGSDVFGILNADPEVFLKKPVYKIVVNHIPDEFKVDSQREEDKVDAFIQHHINNRITAKKNKDWAAADKIRADLKLMSVALEDHPDGTTSWRYALDDSK